MKKVMLLLLLGAVTQGKKDVTHPWIGLQGQDVTQEIALSLGMTQPSGILVKALHSESPAAKAGLHIGDVIISINGRDIEDPEAFKYRIATLPLGSTADFGILRQGQKSVIHVPMIAAPEIPPRDETSVSGANPVSGAKLANLSPAVAEEMGLTDDAAHGVVVTRVKDGSVAAQIGLQPGDLIVVINGKNIANVDEASSALRGGSGGWKLTIRRGDSDITMAFGR